MMRLQRVEESVHGIAVASVAAVDVASASGVVCSRVPREGQAGRLVTDVWTVEVHLPLIPQCCPLRRGRASCLDRFSVGARWRPRLRDAGGPPAGRQQHGRGSCSAKGRKRQSPAAG